MQTVWVGDVVDDLEALIRADILYRLPEGPTGELVGMGTADLVVVYPTGAVGSSPVPRRVHRARELVASAAYATHREVVDKLANRIAVGDDVTPHLSRNVAVACTQQSGGRTRPDLDRLLAEWGLHHLHPLARLDPDGFVRRSDDLLFLAIQPADAYLIAVLPHGAWTSLTLAETACGTDRRRGSFTSCAASLGLLAGWKMRTGRCCARRG